MAVLVVLGPPEQLGPGHAHLLDDVARRSTKPHHEPHSPTVPSGWIARGKQNAALGSWPGVAQKRLEAVGVGHDVVVEDPGEVELARRRNSSKASAQPPAGPRLVSERTTDTGSRPWPRSLERRTGGSLALSTTRTAPGGRVWPAMAVEAAGQGVRRVVRQHHGQHAGARAPGVGPALVGELGDVTDGPRRSRRRGAVARRRCAGGAGRSPTSRR